MCFSSLLAIKALTNTIPPMKIISLHIITFDSNKKCLGLCAILSTQLSFPPVCAKRQGKQLYKMHRQQKLADTANNVLSSTLKFKCTNYTNIGRDETGKKGREEVITRTLISHTSTSQKYTINLSALPFLKQRTHLTEFSRTYG